MPRPGLHPVNGDHGRSRHSTELGRAPNARRPRPDPLRDRPPPAPGARLRPTLSPGSANNLALAKAATSVTAMIEAYSEQLITIDELRARMPHLRAREATLRSQIDALDTQAADRDAYLKLADDLEGFRAQLRANAGTATVEERQRELRLLVKDILVGPEKITIRPRIPARAGPASSGRHDTYPDTQRYPSAGYHLRCGLD